MDRSAFPTNRLGILAPLLPQTSCDSHMHQQAISLYAYGQYLALHRIWASGKCIRSPSICSVQHLMQKPSVWCSEPRPRIFSRGGWAREYTQSNSCVGTVIEIWWGGRVFSRKIDQICLWRDCWQSWDSAWHHITTLVLSAIVWPRPGTKCASLAKFAASGVSFNGIVVRVATGENIWSTNPNWRAEMAVCAGGTVWYCLAALRGFMREGGFTSGFSPCLTSCFGCGRSIPGVHSCFRVSSFTQGSSQWQLPRGDSLRGSALLPWSAARRQAEWRLNAKVETAVPEGKLVNWCQTSPGTTFGCRLCRCNAQAQESFW